MSYSITRRQFGQRTVGLAGALAAACSPTPAEERPNIILCMGDDHGWDETGYNGHPHLRTPVLDEMAETGLRMDRFYSVSPVCSPTRGSVITGRHPNRYGTFVPNYSIRPEEISIAKILGDAGYACGHFGKWHLGPVKAESPTNPGAMGFDEWLSHDNFFELNPYFSRNGGPPEQFRGESSEILIDEAMRFISAAEREGRPSFTVVWFGSRNFRNFHHPAVSEEDFSGPRAILDNRYKLVIDGQPGSESVRELFDLRVDQAEQNNLIETRPEIAANLERRLRDWQQSVLNSLTGADYS